MGSDSKKTEELLENENYPYKKIHSDWSEIFGMMEEDWHDLWSEDSLRYYYTEEVEDIL